MINVIKPSKLSYVFTCTNYKCQCTFSCEDCDLKKYNNFTFVVCPICKKKVKIIQKDECE